MRRFLALALLSTAMVIVPAGAVSADSHLSPGCVELNDPRFDGYYTSMSGDPFIEFYEGEVITVTAGPPDTVTAGAGVQLWVSPGGTFVQSAFPGTATYVIPAGSSSFLGIMWEVRHFIGVPAEATWEVRCDKPDGGVLEVDVDIQPRDSRNRVSLRRTGMWVAVLTTPDFDATSVDSSTVAFGPAGATPRRVVETDVDGDGDIDLSMKFPIRATGLDTSDSEACLSGETLHQTEVEGCDAVQVVARR